MNQNKAKTSTRIIASILDLLLFLLLFFCLTKFIAYPLICSTDRYKTNYLTYESRLLSSGLVNKVENNIVPNIYSFNINNLDEYEQQLTNFYFKLEGQERVDEYHKTKQNYLNLFSFDESTNSYNAIIKEENINGFQQFYFEAYNQALDNFYFLDTLYQQSYNVLNFLLNIGKFSTIFISAFVVYFLFPLIFKNGQTVGKKMFNLELVNPLTNQKIKTSQLLIRFIFISVIELFTSLYIYGLPLLISLVCIIVSKKNFALHDYLAKTMVINKTHNIDQDVIEVESIEK